MYKLGYNKEVRSVRDKAIQLRKKGKTYSEIQTELGQKIPKGTMSYWCSNITLSKSKQARIEKLNESNLAKGRKRAVEIRKEKKEKQLADFNNENSSLWKIYDQSLEARKIALAVLFIAEGGKRTSSVVLGNSDENIIRIFLNLMRSVYKVDEDKFRVTVQCRADQNYEDLEVYWKKVTKISKKQFYKHQIDKRTIGKPTKKHNYKGVCRIDYFSAHIAQELIFVANMLENR